MLVGSWLVYCPHCGSHDQVDGITVNHDCEKCDRQSFMGGMGQLLCPHPGCGQRDPVAGGTEQHACSKCGRSMRLG